ncbi:hypothetical protein [Clostridium oryzae]|uniref:Uncharacterized protein n=1 Tax=Clostridium oryzae TaxID=1450648 RepID=A0A1V4I5V6_9CLOT|nr:hypothetical protein [Clostridium oryzae]OPJ55343.1 hypothetical protein CLORY_44350 [Clostridium oryzae]
MSKQRKVIDVDLFDENNRNENQNKNSQSNFDFNNIDISQLMGLLKNVDINQLTSMMGGLGDLSSIIGGSGGFLGNLLGGLGSSTQEKSSIPNYSVPYSGDKSIAILSALKPMVSVERAALIDMVIQLYAISRILRR